ncbi:MAG: anhydro-N-acetylmuramic acid kinase [Flavobacteriales bacterium]|nr:anhydro-N-acetylmuramic acid kinase [Flavobacteriales bacterium]MCB9446871.1 anhydro-N-acetylmuramic acid kinase [Flavobacteriales bacterium]
MEKNQTVLGLGLMSGTSLDGVDLALCRFERNPTGWQYDLLAAETERYPDEWANRLSTAHALGGRDLMLLDRSYGKWLGQLCLSFIQRQGTSIDIIASHGHTLFHEPGMGMNWQVGNGNEIAAVTGCTVACDFRSLDVALGGQGAPLVPIGDRLLFGSYAACLNLGGFANISYEKKGNRMAFDITACNVVFNALAGEHGQPYDENGQLARSGRINHSLLDALNNLSQTQGKSLGREWYQQSIGPLIDRKEITAADRAATYMRYLVAQLAGSSSEVPAGKILVTGGGAYNSFLMEELNRMLPNRVEKGTDELINFKEAIVFAFLGVLRMHGEVNVLQSVTGGRRDSSSGILISGDKKGR